MTRAAARLHLSEQALSMSMRALERELGLPLLDRSRRGVALLASGEALYADAVPLLAAATAVVGRVRRADRGEPELLRIGHTPAVTGVEVTEMLAGVPLAGVSVQLVAILPDELGDRLRDHSIDVGLSRATTPPHCRRSPRDPRRRGSCGRLRLHRPAARPVPEGRLRATSPGRAGSGHPAGDDRPRQRRRGPGDRAAGTGDRGAVRVLELEPATTVPVLATWRRDARSAVCDVLLASLAS